MMYSLHDSVLACTIVTLNVSVTMKVDPLMVPTTTNNTIYLKIFDPPNKIRP